MAKAKVLVVEDERMIAELLKGRLERAGFAVRVAADGLAACRAIGEERPDVVLLDLLLPVMDGWEVCSIVRTLPDPVISSTPILMITSQSREEDRLKGLGAGADDYITKPFSVDEVILRVRNLLSRARTLAPDLGSLPRGQDAEELLAFFCHEAKNHLIAISGLSRRIHANAGTMPQEKLAEHAVAIRKSSDYLETLVEDIALFQEIDSGRLDVPAEAIRLDEVVDDVVASLMPLAEEKGIRIEATRQRDLPEVLFHRNAGRVCVSNLVRNAIKFSPPGTEVTVRLSDAPGGKVVLLVEDRGPGIPEAERELVFGKFYRGLETRKTTKGTGLGLYVVKALTDASGATVRAEGRSGGGARFRMEFRKTVREGEAGGS